MKRNATSRRPGKAADGLDLIFQRQAKQPHQPLAMHLPLPACRRGAQRHTVAIVMQRREADHLTPRHLSSSRLGQRAEGPSGQPAQGTGRYAVSRRGRRRVFGLARDRQIGWFDLRRLEGRRNLPMKAPAQARPDYATAPAPGRADQARKFMKQCGLRFSGRKDSIGSLRLTRISVLVLQQRRQVASPCPTRQPRSQPENRSRSAPPWAADGDDAFCGTVRSKASTFLRAKPGTSHSQRVAGTG